MKKLFCVFAAVVAFGLTALPACGQITYAATGRHRSANQLSATYEWTKTDYSYQVSTTDAERIQLNGGAVEYSFRKFYPIEIVGAAQYSQGQPLGQRLMSAEAGLGYSRVFNKVVPFGRLLAGEARTSSNQYMYSIRGSKTGLAMGLSAGVNYELAHHIGIRVIQLQNQYLPFGSLGSVYWSIGSGINYQLGTARTRE